MTLTLRETYREAFKIMEPHGFVSLEAVGGTDLTIVNAARCSFDQLSKLHYDSCPVIHDEKATCQCGRPGIYKDNKPILTDKDKGLIGFLMREGHTSPFEQVETWWRLRLPIFVIRQWQRHRMAEMNEESGRYSKLQDQYWLPLGDGAVRTQVGKPGSYTFEAMSEEDTAWCLELMEKENNSSVVTYHELLDRGLAKEVARTVLPVSMYSTLVWKVNLHTLMHFLLLRNDEHAQREIREAAEIMEAMIRPHVPVTMEHWEKKFKRGAYAPAPRIEDNEDGSCGGCGAKPVDIHSDNCPNWIANMKDSVV